jgi:hypothetical protein
MCCGVVQNIYEVYDKIPFHCSNINTELSNRVKLESGNCEI